MKFSRNSLDVTMGAGGLGFLTKDGDRRIDFVHSPRTGGASFTWFVDQLHSDKKIGDYVRVTPHMDLKSMRRVLDDQLPCDEQISFTIIRHPLDNILSKWNYMITRDKAVMPFRSWWDNHQKDLGWQNPYVKNADHLVRLEHVTEDLNNLIFDPYCGFRVGEMYRRLNVGHHKTRREMIPEDIVEIIREKESQKVWDYYE